MVWLIAGSVQAGLYPMPGAHPCVCTQILGEHFVTRSCWGKVYGHLYLSGLIYSTGFYLIGLTPPLFPHVFPNARKALHISLLCMFGKCVSDHIGRLLKTRLELL